MTGAAILAPLVLGVIVIVLYALVTSPPRTSPVTPPDVPPSRPGPGQADPHNLEGA